jgi:MinD-like ATPase involved in chromosome partitioning or flagellar assembly
VINSITRPRSNSHENSNSLDVNACSVAVWGSAGSGKTLLAINLAFELARFDKRVLLVDLDMKRPSVSAWLGLTEAGPGITAALRLAKSGRLSIEELQRLCAELKFSGSHLDVLPGLSSPRRSSEVTPQLLDDFGDLVFQHYDFVVFDLNDEFIHLELQPETDKSREEIATWAIERSEIVLAPFVADPVGVNRFLFDCQLADFEYWPIANRVSTKTLGNTGVKKLRQTIELFTKKPLKAEFPIDTGGCETSIANARPLLLESPNSKLTLAIRSLAGEIADRHYPQINSQSGKT